MYVRTYMYVHACKCVCASVYVSVYAYTYNTFALTYSRQTTVKRNADPSCVRATKNMSDTLGSI